MKNQGLSPDSVQVASASCFLVSPLSVPLFLRQKSSMWIFSWVVVDGPTLLFKSLWLFVFSPDIFLAFHWPDFAHVLSSFKLCTLTKQYIEKQNLGPVAFSFCLARVPFLLGHVSFEPPK